MGRRTTPDTDGPGRAGWREILESLYAAYNRREYVSPDPLEFLYRYGRHADREAVGLIASSLAYGRVASIRTSIAQVLAVLGEHPAEALAAEGETYWRERLCGFRHRFSGDCEVAAFLSGIGCAIREHGTLERLFCSAGTDAPILERMDGFARAILGYAGLSSSHLLPCASKGSACKRLSLYLRWMSRKDDVDPGGWSLVSPCDIMVPLDTHMFRIAHGLGFITRSTPDAKAAIEATEGFRAICPEDPARYDFALTRFGIRTGLSVDDLLAKFRAR